ncbi:MAG: hypothetical protein ACM34I_05025 [bacterium]
MAKGFQQSITYKGLPFLISTSDMGKDNPLLVSSLVFEGTEIAAEKIPYDDIVLFERLEEVLTTLMGELGEKVKTLLLEGFYDTLIEKTGFQRPAPALSPAEAVQTIVMPFIEDRFGKTISQKIAADLLAGHPSLPGNGREAFVKLCRNILDYQIGATRIFTLMFGEHTDTLLKEWLDEFNTLTLPSLSAAEIPALDAIQKHVLPELQNVIGKFMTFKVWDRVQAKSFTHYAGMGESEKFIKLCHDILSSVVGFYSPVEIEEKIRTWHGTAYPAKTEQPKTPSIGASDAVMKIVLPDIVELLGKYIADKLILDAIRKIPMRSNYEYGMFTDIISFVLTSDLITNLCDDYWIEQKRKEWVNGFERLSAGEISSRR